MQAEYLSDALVDRNDPTTAPEASGTAVPAYAAALAAENGDVPAERVETGSARPGCRRRDREPDGGIGRTVVPPGGPFSRMVLTPSFLLRTIPACVGLTRLS